MNKFKLDSFRMLFVNKLFAVVCGFNAEKEPYNFGGTGVGEAK
jgi:hypothetical protein